MQLTSGIIDGDVQTQRRASVYLYPIMVFINAPKAMFADTEIFMLDLLLSLLYPAVPPRLPGHCTRAPPLIPTVIMLVS